MTPSGGGKPFLFLYDQNVLPKFTALWD